jgi:hypothetical protein
MSSNVTRHALVLFVVATALLGAVAPTAIAAVDTTADAPAASTASDAAAGTDSVDAAAGIDSIGSTDATLSVGSGNASTGETVTVPVVVTGENVAGYQANLTWDASVLRFESVSGVNFSDPVTNRGSGWVFATQSQSDGVDSPTVARVTFTVVGNAGDETTIAFEARDSSVNNESVQLDTALESGSVSVDASADAEGDATTTSTAASDDAGTAASDDASTASGSATTDGDDETTTGSQSDGSDGGDSGVSPTLLVGGVAGASGILGAGYLLGKQTGGGNDDGSE